MYNNDGDNVAVIIEHDIVPKPNVTANQNQEMDIGLQ